MSNYQYKVNGVDYQVEIEDINDNIATVKVNGKSFEVELTGQKKKISTHRTPVTPPKAAASAPAASPAPESKPKSTAAGAGNKVYAPLPGTIIDVKVNVGDTVKTGDTVVILEAMKMQNNIEADSDGKITSVLISKGDTVMEGAVLVTIG
jgi:biotin carboxyl carrier protein